MTERADRPAGGTGRGMVDGTAGSTGGGAAGGAGRGAAPGWRRHLAVRGGDWAFAILGLPVALLGGLCAIAVLYAGVLLSLTVVGLPFVVLALLGVRRLGAPQRWLVGRLLGERIEPPAPLPRPAGALARGRVVLTDPVAWRVLLHLVLRLPLGVLGFAAAVLLPLGGGWLVGFPLWIRLLEPGPRATGWPEFVAVPLGLVLLASAPGAVRALSGVNRRLARVLLGPVRAQQRVRQLENARTGLIAANTDRLRGLERDLHDGTQARLVALAITLALAEDALGPVSPVGPVGPPSPDPAPGPGTPADAGRLRALVTRARGQTDDTIAELRLLTRGIHPVTPEGGLGEALPGLTATCPVPVDIRLDLRQRPEPAIEQAVYYCVAELLTNIAKHSGARSAELAVRAADGRVRLLVRDDGRGGAAPGGGSGLAGLAERLAAVDGVLRVDSPPGGPTTVTADLPTAL
ncbi:sensor histidine kinase [Kitasatospora purpeofusca]|uniref:histidine kinase n=1 Tax=Kitasatospora purpeofusca TaxID=67352 RepID=A0ABZ1UDH5_9ACTN|nr:sensor domain-containing protein [Kitasatospora purpeofusca]